MWYAEGLCFACTGCGRCCTEEGFVWIDRHRAAAIADHLGIDLAEFGRRYLRLVAGRLSLIEKKGGECIFWQDGCGIYPARPTQCRTYPFWQIFLRRPADWEEAAGECEGIGRGRRYPADEIRRLVAGEGAAEDGG